MSFAERNAAHIALINRVKVDLSRRYDTDKLYDEKIGYMAAHCASVLDFGKSSRERFSMFRPGQADTADINQYDGYPDYLCDICDAATFPKKTYDGIVCNSVIEHVYEPAVAVRNMHAALNPGGVVLCFAPFIYRYHAPKDLHFQDYFRFTRDGMAYMFRDFSDVTMYPVRGRTSGALNIGVTNWKPVIERRFPWVNRFVDKMTRQSHDALQCSGYVVWAVK